MNNFENDLRDCISKNFRYVIDDIAVYRDHVSSDDIYSYFLTHRWAFEDVADVVKEHQQDWFDLAVSEEAIYGKGEEIMAIGKAEPAIGFQIFADHINKWLARYALTTVIDGLAEIQSYERKVA